MTITKAIPITDIEVPAGGRDLREDKVTDLAQSIQRVGLLSPIGVRIVYDAPRLVYGRHRLAAARTLGWTEIDCCVIGGDDRHARMAEIAENLHRAELTVIERSDQIAEWLELSEEGVSVQVAQKLAPGRPESGASAAAREIGLNRDAARRAVQIAALPIEAKAAAKQLGLDDNQSALLKAAKSPDPTAALHQHAEQTHHRPEASEDTERAERKAERQRGTRDARRSDWMSIGSVSAPLSANAAVRRPGGKRLIMPLFGHG